MSQTSRAELIRDLRQRIRQVERAHRSAPRERVNEDEHALTLSRSHFLTSPLSHVMDRSGALIEWLSDGEGTGAATLALALTPRLLQNGGALVVIDSAAHRHQAAPTEAAVRQHDKADAAQREFYPPAAAALGIPLEQTVIVRPASARDALWAWEQSLRSGAAAVALGWVETLNDRAFRRLQLAAETGGSLGFLLRPASCRAAPSWAEARLLVTPGVRSQESGVSNSRFASSLTPDSWPLTPGFRRLRLEVLHCRGGAEGQVIELELSDEADSVRLAPRLANPASAARAARA
jgi:hypothetical protein